MDGEIYSREVAFSQPVINIGADGGNDIVLRGESISDFHAMMHFDNTRWYITPLDNTQRTTVNGRVIDESGAALQNSSVVIIGDYKMTLMLNGINADIIIQYQGMASLSQVAPGEIGESQNILLAMTGSTPTEIEAGASVEFELTVTNAGPLVANMQLQLQGVPSAWVQIIPPVLNLNEGRKGSFTVRITPPREPSSEAGYYNIRFIAISPNYQRETASTNGAMTILPYSEFLLNGPTPRRLTVNRRKQNDTADVVILNNSNSSASFLTHSYDDSNELLFAYERNGNIVEGQENVQIRAGDNARIPIRVSARKYPLFGFSKHTYHYYTVATPSDHPGEGQSVMGDVVVKPQINTWWLLFTLAVLLIALFFIMQPYIHVFRGVDEQRTQVILYGNSAQLHWDVSAFATKVTISGGETDMEVSKKGSQYFTPTVSTAYTIKAENFLSKLMNLTYEKTVQVLIIPQRPKIDNFSTDMNHALFDQSVTLTWSVDDNATSAYLTYDKKTNELKPESFSGTLTQGYQKDTLFSLRARNNSGFEIKSQFLNVRPDKVDLLRYIVWVRPNGIAVPNDNDSRRTTRWSALQLLYGNQSPTAVPRPASGNPQPAAQSNTLDIPDDFNNSNMGPRSMDPEQAIANGGTMVPNNYVYQTPSAEGSGSELLVSPSNKPTATPTPVSTAAAEVVSVPSVRQTAVPETSPEGVPFNRDFSIKYAEIFEDPTSDSGFRVLEYFPDYQLQSGEQIVIEWKVDGVSSVKIENLSTDALNSSGGSFASPEKTVTYTLNAVSGSVSKSYAMPVRVAGSSDDGEGSGLNCDLKANSNTLTVPGSVMLTWTGGGNNRVQLLSSAKAESDSKDEEKKKKEAAEQNGGTYTQPTNQPLSGGIIGDYLQPSGFLRVNVEKQTTFILNAYDGNGNVICTKSVEVKMQGGNDKIDVNSGSTSFEIVRIADASDIEHHYYAVGQTIQYTIAFKGFEKGKEPTGSVVVTDGASSCTIQLPATTCSLQPKKAGDPAKDYELTVTANYGGDNTYAKATTTAKEHVIDKIDTKTNILAAFKPKTGTGDVILELDFDEERSFEMVPTGVITLTTGSGTCNLNVDEDTMTCEGTVKSDKENPYHFTLEDMLLPDPNADRITAAYKGDDYFSPSSSTSVLFRKVPTKTVISEAYKLQPSNADFTTALSWEMPWTPSDEVYPLVKDLKPTGTITFTPMSSNTSGGGTDSGGGNCVYDIGAATLSCDGNVVEKSEPFVEEFIYEITDMLVTGESDRIKAVYSGDALFNASNYTLQFTRIPTTAVIAGAKKNIAGEISLTLTVDKQTEKAAPPAKVEKDLSGTITFNSGSATCIYVIDQNSVQNCSATVTAESDGHYIVTGMLMSGETGDTISATYSGDSVYLASTSPTAKLDVSTRTDTEITIEKASKSDQNRIKVTTRLAAVNVPEKNPPSHKPTGKVVYTSGTATCTLIIEPGTGAGWTLSFEKCSAESADITDDGQITILGMVMEGTPGENIYAEYKGDDEYNSSVSASVPFSKYDTAIVIETAVKDPENRISLTVALDPAEGPTGTVTFKSGSATCILQITDRKKLQFEACSGTAEFTNGIFVITDMVMNGMPGDGIYAEYGGDGEYNGSVSAAVAFTSPDKINTMTVLDYAYLTGSRTADFEVTLSWNKEEADGNIPTGTLTFTIGKDTCKLDIASSDFGCMDNSTEFELTKYPDPVDPEKDVKYVWEFKNVALQNDRPDKIKAVYSGDPTFNPSTSNVIDFITVDTELEIPTAQKSPKGNVSMTVELSWYDDPPAGKTPTGKITLTSGTKTCTLDLASDPLQFDDCDAEAVTLTKGTKKWTFDVRKMEMGTKVGDSVTAKYSGDGTFLDSSAEKKLEKLVTKLDIQKASKPGDMYANLTDLLLSWDSGMSEEKTPTGTITLTFGSSGSTVCKLDIKKGDFDCSDETTTVVQSGPQAHPDPDYINGMEYAWHMMHVLLKDKSADRVKAVYSGDDYFESSSSLFVMLDTSKWETKLEITRATKPGELYADITDMLLSWNTKESGEKTPSGTITLTFGSSGSTVCKLDIESSKFDCSDDSTNVNRTGPNTGSSDWMNYDWKIRNILLKDKTADRVKADYSGDDYFAPSSSLFMLFDTVETKLSIIHDDSDYPDVFAYKPEKGYASFDALLSWDTADAMGKKPSGTITFTMQKPEPVLSNKCVLTLDTGKMDCEGTSTEVDLETDGNRHYELRRLLMQYFESDRVQAVYSGDGFFMPSTSTWVLFKTSGTTTTIKDAKKTPNGVVSMTLSVKGDLAHPDGKKPLGMIKITSGTKTCTMDTTGGPDKAKFNSDCVSDPIVYNAENDVYQITGLEMGSTSGNTIVAVYSGDDAFYLGSTSPTVDFFKVDTTIDIEDPQKSDSNHVGLKALLSWDKAKADGKLPTGTVTLTIGSASCKLTFDDNENKPGNVKDFSCSEKGVTVITPSLTDADPDEILTWAMTNILLPAGTTADRVKAEYSGDANFNPSSSDFVIFDTSKWETKLEITGATKKGDLYANITDMLLSWNTAEAGEKKPTGIITLTFGSNGSTVCKLDVESKKFDCSDVSTTIDRTGPNTETAGWVDYDWKMINILLKDKTADRVKADYSGDDYFAPSSSLIVMLKDLDKIDTKLDIKEAFKPGDMLADIVDMVLSWDHSESAGILPTGTITLTFGSDSSTVCKLDIYKTGPKDFDCSVTSGSEQTKIVRVPDSDSTEDVDFKWNLNNIVLKNKTADRVKAEYSGDYNFNPSNTIVMFEKIPTQIMIEPDPYKPTEKTSTFDSLFNWVIGSDDQGQDVYGTDKIDGKYTPKGKITFIASDKKSTDVAKCVYDIDEQTFDCKGKDGDINVSGYQQGGIDYVKYAVNKVLLGDSTTDRVRAEYSGDSIFEASKSTMMPFLTIPTELDLTATKDTKNAISLTLKIIPDTAGPDGKKPTGKIVFLAGATGSSSSHGSTGSSVSYSAEACEFEFDLDKGTKKFSHCSGEASITPDGKNLIIRIDNLLVNGNPGDNITAEYSGDSVFIGSASGTVKVGDKIDTAINIDPASKKGNTVSLTAKLTPAGDETGTITFTSGAGTCTMKIDDHANPVFEKCSADSVTYNNDTIVITGMHLSAVPGDSIYAEYSGDAKYNKSTSPAYYFEKVGTTLDLDNLIKNDSNHVGLQSLLSWDKTEAAAKLPAGTIPTGTITFTIGSQTCKLSFDDESEGHLKDFTCSEKDVTVITPSYTNDGSTISPEYSSDDAVITWTLEKILLSVGNTADRVKAEYSGDDNFNASSSDYYLFPAIPTTTGIVWQEKTPAGLVNTEVMLDWTGTPPEEDMKPTGTIKLTSGSAVCTLDISASPVKFTDCSGNVTVSDKNYAISDLDFGSNAGGDITAEYSGDQLFLKSKSDKKFFSKVDTALVFTSAYKPDDPSYVNFVSVLSWDKEKAATRKPTGTIKYTVGSGVCELNLSTNKLSCEAAEVRNEESPEGVTDMKYTITAARMLLSDKSADRIKAEYSGDAVFNPSSTAVTLFHTVETEIRVVKAKLVDEKHISIKAGLDWDEEKAMGRQPAGTIKFVMGSGSCTLTIATGKMSCEPAVGSVSADRKYYTGTDMLMDDMSTDRVSAEYSGDGFFKPSVSTKVLFDIIDTEVKITTAQRVCNTGTKQCTIDLKAVLSWDDSEQDTGVPTGTMKITVGNQSVTYDLSTRKLGNEERDDVTDDQRRNYTFTNIVLTGEDVVSASEVKIEYSGDRAFRKSESDPVKFSRVDTEVTIASGKTTYGGSTGGSETTLVFHLYEKGTAAKPAHPNGAFKIEIFTDNATGRNCQLTLDTQINCGNFSGVKIETDGNGKYILSARDFDGSTKLRTASVKYLGDNYFNPSDVAEINGTYYGVEIVINHAVKQPGDVKYLQFDINTYDPANPSSHPVITSGYFEFSTPGGDSCKINVDGSNYPDSPCDMTLERTSGANTWKVKGLKLGNEDDEWIGVRYKNPSESYSDGFALHSFDQYDTELNNVDYFIQYQDQNTFIRFYMYYQFVIDNLFNLRPLGTMVITMGSYTCTADILNNTGNSATTQIELHPDCGEDAGLTITGDGSGTVQRWDRIDFHARVTDPVADTINVTYNGNTIYRSSILAPASLNRVDSTLSVEIPAGSSNDIITKIDDSVRQRYPTGTVTYRFNNSGTACTVSLTYASPSEDFGTDCNGSVIDRTHTNGKAYFTVRFNEFDPADTDVTVTYSGDGQHNGAETTAAIRNYDVTITPDTAVIYSDGRLYLNTIQNAAVSYPLYPERYGSNALIFCKNNPSSAECHTLKDQFKLKVTVTPDTSDVDMTGETITFSGDFSQSPVSCTLSSIGNGQYGCTTTASVLFNTAGSKTITAAYGGNPAKRLNSSQVQFPEMFAIAVSNALKPTTTVITAPAKVEIGKTVTVEAETFETANPGNKLSNPVYLFYTYDRENNVRLSICTGTSCELTIGEDADMIVVEFLGDNIYAGSIAQKMAASPVTLSVGDLSPVP